MHLTCAWYVKWFLVVSIKTWTGFYSILVSVLTICSEKQQAGILSGWTSDVTASVFHDLFNLKTTKKNYLNS